MRLSTAVKFIILMVHASSYVPFVLCKKDSMRDATTDTTTVLNGNNNDERMMFEADDNSSSSSSKEVYYPYRRNYVAIIEPDNFETVFPNGGGIGKNIDDGLNFDNRPLQLQGSSTILNGKVYDPADIEIVNKPNGFEENDMCGRRNRRLALGLPFAGGRQPKQPIPPGDPAFFYHGTCVATSSINGDLEQAPTPIGRQRKLCPRGRELQSNKFGLFINSLTVTSHSCKLNICLGGGGFNCISFYSGTSFVFNVGQQIGVEDCSGDLKTIAEPSLPPPFPSTIIGGTGSFEGIEGTVDIATICGTTGPIILLDSFRKRDLSQEEEEVRRPIDDNGNRRLEAIIDFKLGLIVQTISINSNMPLPVAP